MDFHYNGLGQKCPLPLVKTRQLLKKMTDDDQLTLTISDPASLRDIPRYLTNKGWHYQLQAAKDCTVIIIRRNQFG